MPPTDEKDPKKPSRALSDADISSERISRRRSFLGRTGLLVGGALAVAAGVRAVAADDDDPDKDGDDPASPKSTDPDQKKGKRKAPTTDPDAKKAADPDAKKPSDPDAQKPRKSDPDRAFNSTRS